MTTVDLEVFLFAGMSEPERFGDMHGRERWLWLGAAKRSIAEVSSPEDCSR